MSTPIAPPVPEATFFEIKPPLLNLVMREQFSGIGNEDAAAHLNNFVELCEMQKHRDIDGDIIKLKLFPFSLRGKAKEWLNSLTRNSIDSWSKCKDAFIGKYYPPTKIISMRSEIMKFKQSDNEHVAQAWERMKSLVKNCPTHGLTAWMIIQTFYAGLNYSSRNLLDSAAGGTFMTITLGAATKLLDNMMVNYSEWHTERAPQGKKVNSVEETSSLSDKIDIIMSMLVNGKAHIDPNNVPLASLVAQEEQVDVNFIRNNNFGNNAYGNNAYRNNFGNNNYKPYPPNNGNAYGNSYNNNSSAPSELEVMLKEFISKQTAFNKTIEEKLSNAETNIASLAEAQSSLNKMAAKPETNENPFAATNAIQVRIDENVRLLAELHAKWEREDEIARNISVSTITTTSVEASNSSTTLDDKVDFDLDGCNISEVIKFLQKLAKSPNASAMNMAFTKHITDALIKIKEEKMKHKASIPIKQEDGWEPIINMKVNDFDFKALCDLDSSVSIMPRRIYDMLDLPPLEDCYLNVPLDDNAKKKLMGSLNDVLIMVNNSYVPVDFYVLDVEYNASCPITLGRPFLRTVGAIIDMKEGTIKFQLPLKKGIEHFPKNRENISFASPMKTKFGLNASSFENT